MKEHVTISRELKKFIRSLPLEGYPRKIINDDDYIDKTSRVYIFYPYMFKDAFPVIDQDILMRLSFAGFFYFKAIICFDSILDEIDQDHQEKLSNLVLGNTCQEEAIKILSSIFSSHSGFWVQWNTRKSEYMLAAELDASHEKINNLRDFEKLADYKSSFGKIAIDALHILSGNNDPAIYKDLLDLHKYSYIASQIMDDIQDFNEDIRNRKFNIAELELKKVFENRNKDFSGIDTRTKQKYLYLYGVAEDLLATVEKYLSIARDYCDKYKLRYWKNSLLLRTEAALRKRGIINDYIDQVEKKVRKTPSTGIGEQSFLSRLDDTIIKASSFIEEKQCDNGSWKDYFVLGELSPILTTAFVLINISGASGFSESPIIKNACNYLLKCRQGLWSCHPNLINDNLTTTWALQSLMSNNYVIDPYLKNWLDFQNDDGGFTTFMEDQVGGFRTELTAGENISGWTQSHVCTSATAFSIFTQIRQYQEKRQKLVDYFIHCMDEGTLLRSYWWMSNIYTLSQLIKNIAHFENTELQQLIKKETERVFDAQIKDGVIWDEHGEPNIFYTSLFVDALCSSEVLFPEFREPIKKVVNSLLVSQRKDGSWRPSSGMRLPYFNVMDPNEISVWEIGSSGFNVNVKEVNSLFTTSVSISALNKFKKIEYR